MSKSNVDSEFGLKEDWRVIQTTLEEIVPVYDKTNRYISLGSDLKIRKRGLKLLAEAVSKQSFRLLDLGCGTGKMTAQLLAQMPSQKQSIVLLDPIIQMMRVARLKTGVDGLIAVFENLPFKTETFDAAMAGFAIRDAKNLSKAFDEINGLLKIGGKFLIVDLSKPDSKFKTLLIGIYWRTVAPAIAFLASGMLGLKFGKLAKTFSRLPKNSELLALAKKSGFQVARAEYSMMGAACVLLLSKE
ncbi:MAG: class I SAM-dependent methyltransferase [Nitrososphaerales archaeon]